MMVNMTIHKEKNEYGINLYTTPDGQKFTTHQQAEDYLLKQAKGRGYTMKKLDVEALSEEHAKRVAAAFLGISLNQVKEVILTGKQNHVASTCMTDDHPVKGTRRWATKYEVHTYGSRIALGRDRWEYLQQELVKEGIATKTEALSVAKAMAAKHQMPMMVKIVQVLESHDSSCADILPKTKPMKFRVTYTE